MLTTNSWRSILILYTHLCLVLPSGLFPSGFPTRTLYAPSPPSQEPHAQPISFFSILSPAQYWVRSTDHLAPRYAISSSYLIPPRSKYSPQHHVTRKSSARGLTAPTAMEYKKLITHSSLGFSGHSRNICFHTTSFPSDLIDTRCRFCFLWREGLVTFFPSEPKLQAHY